MTLNERNITIGLPRAMSSSCIPVWDQPELNLVAGACSHAALARVIGRITTRLYSAGGCPFEYRESIVLEIEEDLHKWLEQTPTFSHPRDDATMDAEEEFYDVSWTLRRQQNTLRGALLFTRMLLYRKYVLDALKEPHRALSPLAQASIGKCLDAAMRLARYAGEVAKEPTFNAAFWTTSHLTFCAIAVLVVYLTVFTNAEHKKEIETVLQNALEGHKKLDKSAGSQTHRFLEESRTIAQQRQQAMKSALSQLSTEIAQEECLKQQTWEKTHHKIKQ